MCYNISLLSSGNLELRYAARFPSTWMSTPVYYINAFTIPYHPIILNEEPDVFHLMQWGLIPFWVKTLEDAEKIRMQTMNARSETLFEKPSFRHATQHRRCLIPADGFFEWRQYHGKNYPYYVRLKNEEIFSIAGIYEKWTPKESDETIETFSVITCDANPLMQKLHNKKKRMPVILSKNDERKYLDKELTKTDIESFFKPYPEERMHAYTISRLVASKTQDRNVPPVIEPYEYPELPPL